MKTTMRTHNCGALRKSDAGEKVKLCGWVHRHRDLGGVLFLTLRDRYGITQIVFDPTTDPALAEKASHLGSEWVIAVEGVVQERMPGMANPDMATGEIEVVADSLTILTEAKTPPLVVSDEKTTFSEEHRLTYRYLDFRRKRIAANLAMRHKTMLVTRRFLDQHDFLEISTPILGKSTPEGARDYLVPSRIHPGTFYALPQSPQIFKQLFMIGGLDRYFQIAPCFRDEDLRSDRQPEFHQIDLEMSFAQPEDLFALMEGLMATIFQECLGIRLAPPFRRMSHAEAMHRYGTDRPDVRFGMELVDVTDLAKKSSFEVFHKIIETGGIIKGFCVPGGADLSRKQTDAYAALVGQLGCKGLAFGKKQEGEIKSSLSKFFPGELLGEIGSRMAMNEGDLFFLLADSPDRAHLALDQLRRKVARDRDLIPPDRWAFLWVVDFPLFCWDDEEQRLQSVHHPFTHPLPEDLSLLETNPLAVHSAAYDLVLNGYELGGGSKRIHDPELQHQIFSLLQLSEEEMRAKFGFFIDALRYGTPPHLGIAFGLDRIVMLLTGTDNIRDVIAFPKTIQAQDLLMDSPSEVSERQLKELSLEIK